FMVVCVLAGLLVVVGLWLAFTPGSMGWSGWWSLIRRLLDATLTALTVVVHAVAWCGLPALLVAAWQEGRRAAATPRWLFSPDERAQDNAEITADLITVALRHVKIPALTRYLTGGGVLEYVVPPREQGGGTYTQVRLPMGVTAAELLSSAKVELLAGNVGRHRHEVWPQRETDTDARVLDLWVADKGTMDKPAPPWPLLADGEVDVFRDRLPWGVTMRAEQIMVGMLQKHWLIGATSKQGKSTVLRLLALGLALDPTVELHVADLKGDGDWSMFKPRAATLIEGSADEHAEATTEMLERGVAEVARRYDAKRTVGIVGAIPRELSRRRGSGFHPIYLIVDECQVLYGAPHPIGGAKDDARAWRAAKKLHDQARAVNVHLLQATQRPDDRTLPARVREGAHVRCALNVPNHETAKMILADAADRGARPQDLRPGADAGTVVATGEVEDIPKGQAFAIVRTHYVSTKDAYTVID
ncbi:MAG: ATP-binding protein, partial [Actinobacteria bacterium]|nr:ATP-binding protein [Actinomycetota bacterium]